MTIFYKNYFKFVFTLLSLAVEQNCKQANHWFVKVPEKLMNLSITFWQIRYYLFLFLFQMLIQLFTNFRCYLTFLACFKFVTLTKFLFKYSYFTTFFTRVKHTPQVFTLAFHFAILHPQNICTSLALFPAFTFYFRPLLNLFFIWCLSLIKLVHYLC